VQTIYWTLLLTTQSKVSFFMVIIVLLSMYEANIDENVCAELKKVYFMWSEIQPEVMEPQKCEIKIRYRSENAFIQRI
jgi:hypothetical protein